MRLFNEVPGLNKERAARHLVTPTDVAHVLLAVTAVAVVPPAGAKFAVFKAQSDFIVEWKDGTTAVFPVASAASAEARELNPDSRYIGDRFITSIYTSPNFSVIGTAAGGILTIAFYA